MLLVPDEKRHRTGSDRAAGLELPQRFAGLRVEREEVAFVSPRAGRTRRKTSRIVLCGFRGFCVARDFFTRSEGLRHE